MKINTDPPTRLVYVGAHTRRPDPSKALLIITVVMALLVLGGFGLAHHNEGVRNDPPLACVLLGGNWTWYGGWHCQ